MSAGSTEPGVNGEVEDFDEDEIEEITVVAEEGLVCIQGADWDLELSPDEARELADALIETAKEAEAMEEDDDDEES